MESSPADAQLVADALAGQREAFEAIVLRYQRLVCSVAYSAVGDLKASEDIAQETFVAAWTGLRGLREPDKLRGWLCGTARRLSFNSRRQARSEPLALAGTLDPADTAEPAPEASPADSAARRDDAELVWRALAGIPETYREPLVLYYREDRSVESVARALDLTEDAVKQRLVRGRERLKAEVDSLIEGALRASAPGAAFTQSVMAALPAAALSAKVALGGSALAKTATSFAALGGMVSGVGASFVGSYLGYKEATRGARSPQERAILRRMYRFNFIGMLALFASTGVFIVLDRRLAVPSWIELTIVPATLVVFFSLMVGVMLHSFRALRSLQNSGVPLGGSPLVEYRSRTELWGWPLVHVRFGGSALSTYRPVRAWIALGGVAYGRLFAYGGIAAAPIVVGGIAIGGIAVGGLAVAAAALGGVAAGGLAVGGQVLGWVGLGGSAIAYHAAYGGLAVAHDIAAGPTAHAVHANDAVVRAYFSRGIFPAICGHLQDIGWISLIGIVPLIFSILQARKKRA